MKKSRMAVLLPGLFLAVWCSAVSGFLLPAGPRLLLAMHLVCGFGGLAPLVLFLQGHIGGRGDSARGVPVQGASPARRQRAFWGRVLLVLLVLLTVTGVLLLRWTNIRALRLAHTVLALALVIVMTMHVGVRMARAGRLTLRWRLRRAARLWLAFSTLALLLVASTTLAGFAGDTSPDQPVTAHPPIPLAHATLGEHKLAQQAECATCHTQIAQQWTESAHAQAATDEYYVALATLFMQERGIDALHYCAACHNPVGLVRGEFDAHALRGADRTVLDTGARTDEQSAAAYQARALDVELTMSEAAAEGVTCAVCHQAELENSRDAPTDNDLLRLRPLEDALPSSVFEALVLRTEPTRHARALQPAVLAESALCGTCHNLRSPAGMPLEPTYDEWLASPYPAQGIACQDCHMARARARVVASGLPQPVAVHGGLPGAPSSLPALADAADLTLLQSAADLAVQLEEKGGAWQVTALITNTGAGHFLPTGADDLRQIWLEASLYDEAGTLLWQSGAVDDEGRLDANAIRFQKILGNSRGQPIELHRFWIATQILADTRLAPLEARTIRYGIEVAPELNRRYRLLLRLLYRDVPQSFAEFAAGGPVAELPIYEMARAESVVHTQPDMSFAQNK